MKYILIFISIIFGILIYIIQNLYINKFTISCQVGIELVIPCNKDKTCCSFPYRTRDNWAEGTINTPLPNIWLCNYMSWHDSTKNKDKINAVTYVSNAQGNCGSCVVFALVATVESLNIIQQDVNLDNIKSKKFELSVQYLINCYPKYIQITEMYGLGEPTLHDFNQDNDAINFTISKKLIDDKVNVLESETHNMACFYLGESLAWQVFMVVYLILYKIAFQKNEDYPYLLGSCNKDNFSEKCMRHECDDKYINPDKIYINDLISYQYDSERDRNLEWTKYTWSEFIKFMKYKLDNKGPMMFIGVRHAVCIIGYGYGKCPNKLDDNLSELGDEQYLKWIIKNSHNLDDISIIIPNKNDRFIELFVNDKPVTTNFIEFKKNYLKKKEDLTPLEKFEYESKERVKKSLDFLIWKNFGNDNERIIYERSTPPPPPFPPRQRSPIRISLRPNIVCSPI